jgi:hypothetical protein
VEAGSPKAEALESRGDVPAYPSTEGMRPGPDPITEAEVGRRYANIARFVKDAVDSGYDTVSIRSSQDAVGEDVWLPGCDTPLKVSNAKPELDVTIYKSVESKK